MRGHLGKKGWTVLVDGGKDTGGLDDVIGTNGAPRDAGGIPLGENGDGFALNIELTVLGLDGSLESSMDRIVLEHVNL